MVLPLVLPVVLQLQSRTLSPALGCLSLAPVFAVEGFGDLCSQVLTEKGKLIMTKIMRQLKDTSGPSCPQGSLAS